MPSTGSATHASHLHSNVIHLVFSTKDRRKTIPLDFQPKLWAHSAGAMSPLDRKPGALYQSVKFMEFKKSAQKIVWPAEPKARLERLLSVSSIVLGYFYVWTFQEYLKINVKFIDVSTLLRLPIISIIVIPLTLYLYVKPDWLQRGRPHFKSVRFFQAQFPSLYIKQRCGKCSETAQTCRNFIGPESREHNSYWLDHIWRPIIKKKYKEQFDRTFEKGYTCKLLFGLQIALVFFAIVAVVTMISKPILDLLMRRPIVYFYMPKHLIFVGVCVFVAILISLLNRPDMTAPTGCWHAWREINDAHKLWLRNNEPILVELVCHAGGNDRSFSPRL
jgi:hypothetical protein